MALRVGATLPQAAIRRDRSAIGQLWGCQGERKLEQRRLLADRRWLESAVAEFRASLIVDIRQHPLAWAILVAGAITVATLWACICGLPIVGPLPFDIPVEAAAIPNM
jgi:hypothetical protein